MVGALLVGLFVLAAVLGPLLAPYGPFELDPGADFAPPSADHVLGTAENGLDVASALLHGARLAAVVSLVVVGLSVTFGTLVGSLAGLVGGWVDAVVRRTIDVLLAFPSILLNIAVAAVVARPGIGHLVLALSVNGWVAYARVARGQALSLRHSGFVEAARAAGGSEGRVLVRHVIPNLLGPIAVQATFGVGGVILAESTLSFLGLGPQTAVSWGALLDQGTGYLLVTPRVAAVAGAAIAVTVLGFNLLGDRLRDWLDPKTRWR